ncbi:MAG: hypothetical protein GY939_12775 [Actinomycetia bacterium]|nr:hypothetical protein [Actinomycetes bacterium]
MQRLFRRLLATLPMVVLAVLVIAVGSREPTAAGTEPPGELGFRTELFLRTGNDGWFDTSDRAAVVAAYQREFGGLNPVLEWTGDHHSCEPGTSSRRSRLASIRRVNYYRAMAGVPAIVTEDPELTAKAQSAAIMMSVEGTLTHSPSPDFACFTPTGQLAAANSNLYLGRTGTEAIDGYIEDPGAGNIDVGHRNTILHPPTQKMGIGNVDGSSTGHAANALWVFDDHVFDETSVQRPRVREADRFVAWPPRGHVPSELIHPRWSFMLAGADFSSAEVSLYRMRSRSARTVPVEVVARVGTSGHVPLPTIVWEPDLDSDFVVDETYLVVISGVGAWVGPLSAENGAFDLVSLGSPGPSIASSYSYYVRVIGDDQLRTILPARSVNSGARLS